MKTMTVEPVADHDKARFLEQCARFYDLVAPTGGNLLLDANVPPPRRRANGYSRTSVRRIVTAPVEGPAPVAVAPV